MVKVDFLGPEKLSYTLRSVPYVFLIQMGLVRTQSFVLYEFLVVLDSSPVSWFNFPPRVTGVNPVELV